jgi:hypothetical protein
MAMEVVREIILRKGTVLYSISQILDKPLASLTFHPSEAYRSSADYVAPVELLKDLVLEFRVHEIRHMRLFSPAPPTTPSVANDGYLVSESNQHKIKIVIKNDQTRLRQLNWNPIVWSWTNGTINENGILIPKKWGSEYPIGTVRNPAKFRLPAIFKEKIEKYCEDIDHDDPDGTALCMVLKNAEFDWL